ncbi:unnamed protein product, partial [Symbiodinium sp. CCMP2456]
VVPVNVDNVETQIDFWDVPAGLAVINEAPEKRPPIHTTAPDLKLSEAMVQEFMEDSEQAKISGAVAEQLEVQKAARLAAAQEKVDAAKRKDAKLVAKGSKEPQHEQEEEQEEEEENEAAELKRNGVPIPPGFKGTAKSYTLPARTYHNEMSERSSISVIASASWELNLQESEIVEKDWAALGRYPMFLEVDIHVVQYHRTVIYGMNKMMRPGEFRRTGKTRALRMSGIYPKQFCDEMACQIESYQATGMPGPQVRHDVLDNQILVQEMQELWNQWAELDELRQFLIQEVAQEAMQAAERRKQLVAQIMQKAPPKRDIEKGMPKTPNRTDGIKRLHHKLTPASASTKTPSTATPDAKNPKTEVDDAKKTLFGD